MLIAARLCLCITVFCISAFAYLGLGMFAPPWLAVLGALWLACGVGMIGWFIIEVMIGRAP